MCSAVCQRCAFSADGKPPGTFFVVRDQGAVVAMSGMSDAPVDHDPGGGVTGIGGIEGSLNRDMAARGVGRCRPSMLDRRPPRQTKNTEHDQRIQRARRFGCRLGQPPRRRLGPNREATARRVTAKQPTQAADGRCSNYVLGEFCGGAPAFAKWRLPWRSAV